MSDDLFLWWFLLCAVSALNVLALTFSAAALRRRHPALSDELYVARRWQLLLAAGYVFGCAYRCAFPVFGVQHQVLTDSWLSSVIVGRSLATFAELCFVTQWALLLWEIAGATASRTARTAALALVPMIPIAETFSWYSVLTTSNVGHVVEESLRGLRAVLFVLGLASVWTSCPRRLRPLLAAACAAGSAYVVFMFTVDVPMYWSRWLADEAS
jgi:hypothetical protein